MENDGRVDQQSMVPIMEYHSIGGMVFESEGVVFRQSPVYPGGLCVCGYEGDGDLLDVPSSMVPDGHRMPVTDIDRRALSGNGSVRRVNLPESVMTIGEEAFSRSCVESILMPGVRDIFSGAFMGCPIVDLELPRIGFIPPYMLSGCEMLRSLVMSDRVRLIMKGAFRGCSALEGLSFPDTLIAIEEEAFAGCSSLSLIALPDSLKVIGPRSFRGCTGLSSVVIGNTAREIVNGAFEGCTMLRSVEIPPSVTKLEDDAFPEWTAIRRLRPYGTRLLPA
ncbi:MAG: leucine-rich repeat protein [Candidatus Methanomethylophilaceae archaeon]|nr:leucine-rich repeat protein [Candidatus Methanomethylophilaceae archaeon]MBR4226564.1 leucine-rich repeat protein [Candidatus Methanomethylophilaceae archaeon]